MSNTVPRNSRENTSVAAEQSVRPKAGKRGAKQDAAPAPEQEPLPPERQYVDIDPWAMLLEQLLEMPEEEPDKRKPGSRK